jgi:hypothetical protein
MEAVDLYYFTPKEIADAAGLSVRRIQAGIKRAREMALDLPDIFKIEWISNANAFTEHNQCEWHSWKEIPQGIEKGCEFCLKTGLEWLIARSRPKTEPGKPSPSEKRKSFAERHHKGKKKK